MLYISPLGCAHVLMFCKSESHNCLYVTFQTCSKIYLPYFRSYQLRNYFGKVKKAFFLTKKIPVTGKKYSCRTLVASSILKVIFIFVFHFYLKLKNPQDFFNFFLHLVDILALDLMRFFMITHKHTPMDLCKAFLF